MFRVASSAVRASAPVLSAGFSTKERLVAPGLRAAAAHIDATFDPANSRSFQSNWSTLHNSVAKDLQGLYNDKSDKVSKLDKWEAGELLRWINSLDNFSANYDIERGAAGGAKRLDDLILPEHRDFLHQELGERIKDAVDEGGLSLIAQMAGKGELTAFGVEQPVRRPLSRSASMPASSHANLKMDQLLAITDYTHPDTGTFNAVIPAGRLAQYGQTKVRQAIAPLHEALTSGLDQLSRDAKFGVSADFYKGLNLNANKWGESALWNQTWKDRAREGQDSYSFGHPVSVTDSPEKSYIDREGYDHLAKFSGFRAADVSAFNEGELIIPEGQTANTRIAGFSSTEAMKRDRGATAVETIEFRRAHDNQG